MNEKYPLALPAGAVLAGQYIIEKVLGQGGFGITYEAVDHKTSAKVAVKEFFPDAMATRTGQTTVVPFTGERGESYEYGKSCFLQEAETLAQFIGNENIVRIYSYFEENGTAYFVMEFIEGTSFDEYLKQHGGKVSYEEAVRILTPIMDALSVVHSKGIVHRDVTPDNIYITNEGVVKLLDFGAARYSLGDKSRSLDIVLKHGFAPKEQYTRRGKQGPYTDVYSLGASFYFSLTGKRPQDSIERLDEDDLIPPSALGVQIGPAQEDAILKAMAIQPAERFQNMAEFKRALVGERQGAAAAPAAGSEPTVKQKFFSAPTPEQTAGVASVSAPPPKEALAAPAAGKKPPEKKKLYIVAAAAAAVVILGIFILKPAKDTSLPDDRESRQTVTATDGAGQETMPAEESKTPPKEAGNTSADWRVLGNSVGNLMNGGTCSIFNDKKIFITDDSHSIKVQGEDGPYIFDHLLTGSDYFSGLSVVDDNLYFLVHQGGGGYAGVYNLANMNGEEEFVPGLDLFQGRIQRLLITEDYYVIRVNSPDAVYRVSRTDGESVKCCEPLPLGDDGGGFTMSSDGWLYYVQLDGIHSMRIDTLEEGPMIVNGEGTGMIFNSPLVVDDYIYYLAYLQEDYRQYGIIRTNRWQGLSETDAMWPISQELGMAVVPGFTGFNINIYNHDIYFYTRDAAGNTPALMYQIKGHDDGTFDVLRVAEDVYGPSLFYNTDNGNYSVWYLRGLADESGQVVYQVRYKRYDTNGDAIEN